MSDLLKSITINDSNQEIQVTCKVYNAATNQQIRGTSSLLRDVTITPRLQEFSSTSVPISTKIRLEITTDTSCYLYILNIGTSGSATMLLPSKYDRQNFFQARQTYHFPAKNYEFEIQGPPGKEVIQVMAFSHSQERLNAFSTGGSDKEPLLRDIGILQNSSSWEKRGFALVEFTVCEH